jgi:(2Fe-2S) ferredoxin
MTMNFYKKHVFVCTYGKTCPTRGSQEVLEALKKEVRHLPEGHGIRINKSGCLHQCDYGPMLVIYPEGTWYTGVTPQDCPAIAKSHLIEASES